MNDKADTLHPYDPITLEIIQSSLQAAADEMFATMRRTAMSAIIYEVLDMGTGITDKGLQQNEDPNLADHFSHAVTRDHMADFMSHHTGNFFEQVFRFGIR